MTAGVAVSVTSPKLGVLAYSLAGLTLLVITGVWALHMSQPNWIAMLPATFPTQLATLAGLVTVGVLIQWRLTPGRRGVSTSPPAGAARGRGATRSEPVTIPTPHLLLGSPRPPLPPPAPPAVTRPAG